LIVPRCLRHETTKVLKYNEEKVSHLRSLQRSNDGSAPADYTCT